MIEALKLAGPRSEADGKVYEAGFADFKSILDEADKAYAREQTASAIVQDILVGTLVGLLGPAGIAARTAFPLAAAAARRIVVTTRERITDVAAARVGAVIKGLVDEGLEPVASWAVDAGKDEETSKPSGSAGLAGDQPGEKYKKVVAELNNLIDLLPNLMPLETAHLKLVELAGEAIATGDPGLDKFITRLDAELDAMTGPLIDDITVPFMNLVRAVMSRPQLDKRGVEYMLWSEWVPRLRPPFDELNHLNVREHLEELGLGVLFTDTTGAMTGGYSGDKIVPESAQQISLNAKSAWLAARGVRLEFGRALKKKHHTSLVLSLFEAATYLETLDRAGLHGRSGTFKWPDSVVVDGATYPIAMERPARPADVPFHVNHGDAVSVEAVWPTWDLLRTMARRYLEDEILWAEHPLHKSLVGVEVLWSHGAGNRYRPFGPPP